MALPATYAIHPPPLPEFYLQGIKSGSLRSTSSSSSESTTRAKSLVRLQREVAEVEDPEQSTQAVASYSVLMSPPSSNSDKQSSIPGNGTNEKVIESRGKVRVSSKTVTFPLPPPPQPSIGVVSAVPPLAVYHICRICLRTRSARYHREHPIPVNGVPPPPGICRRCRIKNVGEVTAVRKVVVQAESEPIKLGLASVMPDECLISGKEVEEMRNRQLLDAIDRRRARKDERPPEQAKVGKPDDKKTITYRHIRIRESSPSSTARDKPDCSSTAQNAIDALTVRRATTTEVQSETIMEQPTSTSKQSLTASKLRRLDSVGASKSVQRASSSSSPTTKASPVASAAPTNKRSGYSESTIRRFARDEVERYRQAERKLEAHPNAFAHGRMIPVERRILTQVDTESQVPWKVRIESRVESTEPRIVRQANAKSQTEPPKAPQTAVRRDIVQMVDEVVPIEMVRTTSRSSSSSSSEEIITRAARKAVIGERKRQDERPSREPEAMVEMRSDQRAQSNPAASGRTSRQPPRSAREAWIPMLSTHYESRTLHGEPVQPRQASISSRDRIVELSTIASGEGQSSNRSSPKQPERNDSTRDSRQQCVWDDNSVSRDHGGDRGRRINGSSAGGSDRIYIIEQSGAARQSIEPTEYQVIVTREGDEDRSTPAQSLRSSQQQSVPESRTERRHVGQNEDKATNDDPRPRAFDRRWEEAMKKSAAASEKTMWAGRSINADSDRIESNAKPTSSTGPSGRAARPQESEYYYRERIIEPVRAGDRDRSEKIWSSHSARDIPLPPSRQESVQTASRTESRRHQETNAREWEDTSHVRFASKVDISPTPPGSQASSTEFRIIGSRARSKGRLDGQEERGEELIAEYERRGRSRSRVTASRSRREDGDVGLRRALSKSPSRERIQNVGREAKMDSYGPYLAQPLGEDTYDGDNGSGGARRRAGSDRDGSSRQSAATRSARSERW